MWITIDDNDLYDGTIYDFEETDLLFGKATDDHYAILGTDSNIYYCLDNDPEGTRRPISELTAEDRAAVIKFVNDSCDAVLKKKK